jgi:hypothetical protein
MSFMSMQYKPQNAMYSIYYEMSARMGKDIFHLNTHEHFNISAICFAFNLLPVVKISQKTAIRGFPRLQ